MKLRIPWLTLALGALAVTLPSIPGAASWLELNRHAPTGEAWRWGTAHLVHFNASHLAWDTVALLLLGTWVESVSRRGFVITVALSALAISAAVWWWQPELVTYRGLSGVDSALFGFVSRHLLAIARDRHDRWLGATAITAATLFLAKTGFELISNQTLFVASTGAFVPVPLAHLVGLVCGAVTQIATSRRIATTRAPNPARARLAPATINPVSP